MPRKYVRASSTSSSDISLQYSSEYSSSDSRSAEERRNRRTRKGRHGRSPRRPFKEPSESLHWWLAKWLSSEFLKLANSVYEGGKGCIRYLSNTALQALPNARTARELQGDISRGRRTRNHHRKRRSSPYPGGSWESLRAKEARKSHRKSRHERKERASNPNETYTLPKPRKGLNHGHRSHFSTRNPGSSRSRHCHTSNENWIHEENWIENLLKEVKSNFKNPIKIKVYKATPGEGSSSKSRSDNSQTDSKISISIEELVSPTYPTCNSDVISTSSGRRRSETTNLSTETSVPKTKGEKKDVESTKFQTSHGSIRKRPTGEWKTHSILKIPQVGENSTSRLSPSDLIVVRDGIKDVRPRSRVTAHSRSRDENRLHDFPNCKEGDVFYPSPGRMCRIVCEDVPRSSFMVDSEEQLVNAATANEQQNGVINQKSIGGEDSQNVLPLMHSKDLNNPEAEKEKSHKEEMEVGRRFSGVQIPPDSRANACETIYIERGPSEVDISPSDNMSPHAETQPPSLGVTELKQTILETAESQEKSQYVTSNHALKPVKKESNHSLLKLVSSRDGKAQPSSRTSCQATLTHVIKNGQQAVVLSNEERGTKIDKKNHSRSLISAPTQANTVLSQLFPSKIIPQPEQTPEGSLLPPAEGPKDSSSLTKVAVDRLKSEGILQGNPPIQSAGNASPSKVQLPPGCEAEYPALVKSPIHLVHQELMDETEDKSLSSPTEKGTSKDSSVPYSSTLGVMPADLSTFSVINDPTDRFAIVVQDTEESNGIQLATSSRNVIQSANSILESVTTNSGASSDASSSKMSTTSVTNSTESATSQVPLASNEAQRMGSQKDLVSIVRSVHSTQSNLKESSNTEHVSPPMSNSSVETVHITQKHAEPNSLDSSAVSILPVSSTECEQRSGQQPLISFGEAENIPNTLEAFSSEIKTVKVLERPSISKPALPSIKEEVDSVYEPSPTPSTIAQQRRPSMVTPGVLKKNPRPSAVPPSPTIVDDESEGSGSEYTQRASTYDRCPCKKICECCTCGIRGSEKPSFAVSRSASKDRPSMPLPDVWSKSVLKPQPPRIGAIDLSSQPVPKNSLEVLQSPFYAHWDYYDLDQDHPIARFVRRPDHAEFDNTDTILMKNVRVGGYTIPYLKLQTKEKVSPKTVCNFYKSKKLPFQGKGNSEANVIDLKDDMTGRALLGKEGSKDNMKCECKKVNKEEENIWKDYTREDRADLLDFPSDVILAASKCTSKADDGCMCMDHLEPARIVPMPATPCESCDCFISDVELETAPQLAHRHSNSSDSEDFDENFTKSAVVNEYICGLQELCSNLCAMISKMRLVMEETSTMGSTFQSSRPSPRRSRSSYMSPEESEKQVRKERGK